MNAKYLSAVLFFIVSLLGALYLLVEAILQLQGTSICASEGCRLVAGLTRFGDLPAVLGGFGALSLLSVLSCLNLRSESGFRAQFINNMLIAALAAEGFFLGYQIFWLPTVCVFCLSVLGIFVTLALLRLPSARNAMFAGFGAFVAVLAALALVLPPGGAVFPRDARHVLFYSPDCKHCKEIRKEIEASGLSVEHLLVREYAGTLRSLGVEHVPTLFVNGPYEKILLTGNEAILRYLAACKAARPSGERRPSSLPPVSLPKTTTPSLLFLPPDGPDSLFNPPADEGLCKEEQKCD